MWTNLIDGEGDGESNIILSGQLNFIDGLWSAYGGEMIIVFATNQVNTLDPTLIRKGRMYKHIELSCCSFEAFKILAKYHLDIEFHSLFETIRELLEANKMTPANVVEILTPKSFNEDVKSSLENLVQALEKLKEVTSSEVPAKKLKEVTSSWLQKPRTIKKKVQMRQQKRG